MATERQISHALSLAAGGREYNTRRKDGYGRGASFATTAVALGAGEAAHALTKGTKPGISIVATIGAAELARHAIVPRMERAVRKGPQNSRKIDKRWNRMHPNSRGMIEGAELALTGGAIYKIGRHSGSKGITVAGAGLGTLGVAMAGSNARKLYYYRTSHGKKVRVRNGRKR